MTSLQALAERLEKATGPDREIDAALWLMFTPGATRRNLHIDRAPPLPWLKEKRSE